MKYKNISLIEAHIEKMVFGLCIVLALLIIWSYVVNDPYTVALQRNPQPIAPDEVEAKIKAEAEALEREISKPTSNVSAISVPNYTDEFRKRLIEPIADPTTKHRLGEPGLDENIFVPDEDQAAVEIVIVPEPPAAVDVIARHSFGVLNPPEDAEIASQFKQLLGAADGGPLDFHYATVAGTYDLAKWRDNLRNGPRPAIEEAWWRNLLAITGVLLERSTFDPASNSWGPVEQVPALPGQVVYHSIQGPFLANEAKDLIREIKENQHLIARPDFPGLAAGPAWLPPSKDLIGLAPAQQQRLIAIDREIADLERQLQTDNAAEPQPQPQTRPRQPAAQPRRGPAGPAGAVDPNMMGDMPEEDAGLFGQGGVNRQANQLREQIEAKKRERAELLGRPAPAQAEPFAPADGEMVDPNEVIEPFTVWAHDLTVQPGKTYRYRLRIPVLNPLFQRQNLAPQQREEHLHKLSLEPQEASPWSEAVTIPPEKQFFVIRSNARQNTATFEVWRIFNGRHVFQTFTVQRGDEVGGPVQMGNAADSPMLDMSVNAVLVDLNFDVPIAAAALGAAKNTTQVLLMEADSGGLFRRIEAEDQSSPDREVLRQQARIDGVARTD